MVTKEEVRWKIALPVIFGFSIFTGIYFMFHTETLWVGLLTFFGAIFFLTFLYVAGEISIFQIIDFNKQSSFSDDFMMFLISEMRKYPNAFKWPLAIILTLFISLSAILFVYIYYLSPESAINFIKSVIFHEFLLGFLIFSIILLKAISRIRAKLDLSTILAEKVTEESVEKEPQAMVEHAFTVFENQLREKIKADSSLRGGEDVINKAFGNKGCLIYESMDNQTGVRNLMSDVYATLRNPRKHRLIKDDLRTIITIIKIVDLLIKIVDESKERLPDIDGNVKSKKINPQSNDETKK